MLLRLQNQSKSDIAIARRFTARHSDLLNGTHSVRVDGKQFACYYACKALLSFWSTIKEGVQSIIRDYTFLFHGNKMENVYLFNRIRNRAWNGEHPADLIFLSLQSVDGIILDGTTVTAQRSDEPIADPISVTDLLYIYHKLIQNVSIYGINA